MRLSAYPYIIVRIGCRTCGRRGRYRLARLADRYGAEAELTRVLAMLSGDCKLREKEGRSLNIYDRCGAYYPDLSVGRGRPD